VIWLQLLIAFQIKHYLADFPLQGQYMLGKFKPTWGFLGPLSAHCAVHATFTLIIAMAWGCLWQKALTLAVVDFVVHFTMDRIKASPNMLGRWKPMAGLSMKMFVSSSLASQRKENTLFWWSLGFDQMVHHLTHYYIIWRIIV